MSIEKIGVGVDSTRQKTVNIAKNSQPRAYSGVARDSVSFGALSSKEINKILEDGLAQGKALKFMKKFESLKGELGGILITAVGTGAVAPIFIGFNPFVRPPKNATPEEKEDLANTKKYTAMRQPISAGLAILFQASVQKYIDKGLDMLFNHPDRAAHMRFNLNRSILNTDTYIKDQVKKQMKAEGISQPSMFSDKSQKKAYKADFDARVEKMKNDQLEAIKKNFLDTHEIRIGAQKLDDKAVAEIINKNIDSYISDSRKLQKDPSKIVQYLDKADILHGYKDEIREMFKDIPINDIKDANRVLRSPKSSAAECKLAKDTIRKAYETANNKITTEFLNNLYAQKHPKELKDLINECLILPRDLQVSHAIRILERINCIEKMCNNNYSREAYATALENKSAVLDRRIRKLYEAKIKNPAEASTATIQEALGKIAAACNFKKDGSIVESVLRDTDVYSHSMDELKDKIAKDVAKGYKKLVEHHYKSLNQVTKILVGVFITLPITCTALNWVYPRFMELFFPNLAGVKKKPQPNENKVGGDK